MPTKSMPRFSDRVERTFDETAFNEGVEARRSLERTRDNPYSHEDDPRLYSSWLAGWADEDAAVASEPTT